MIGKNENPLPQMEDEPKVQFKYLSDRDVFLIKNEEIDQPLAEISGYDLQINFNMEFIKSMEDVEAVIQGMGELWRKIILSQLLQSKNEQTD
ncbi:MAG: hypothetical protein PUB73_05795 [Bacteroidales bacterium]|nr:hypothetical protein [Bacteroidales bacterium]